MTWFFTEVQNALLGQDKIFLIFLITGVLFLNAFITVALDLFGWLINLFRETKTDIPTYIEDNNIVGLLLEENERLKKTIEELDKQGD